ncbi:MAG TPA: aquaporin [Gemmatimonadales bacterium]|nr:aquaporin [Gemmatimonadales bacterium]
MVNRGSLNWTEYALESWALGLFMVSACGFAVLLFHPASPVPRALPDPLARRALMGLAMGATAVLNAYSPWGRRSGAHSNPAVTLAFLRLGRMRRRDAAGYIVAQCAGAVLGVALAARLLAPWIADPSVNYVVTMPGARGVAAAFAAELGISFLLMLVILSTAARERLAPLTGLFAGALVALYITVENPLSGMSMNPARSLGSAVLAVRWEHLWLYFLAPPLGMLLAVEARQRAGRGLERACAKLHHDLRYRCLFCEHREDRRAGTS